MIEYTVYSDKDNFYGVTSSLTEAKKMMKEHPGSEGMKTKIWSNGDFENIGKISLTGSNKTMVENSRQKGQSYQ